MIHEFYRFAAQNQYNDYRSVQKMIQALSGEYPFVLPENRAVRDFTMKHRNIAGMIIPDKDNNVTREQKKNPGRLEIQNIPGYQHVDVRWIVKGGSKYTVRAESIKGGRASSKSE